MAGNAQVSINFSGVAKQDVFSFDLDNLLLETQAYVTDRLKRDGYSNDTISRYQSGALLLPLNRQIIFDLEALSESEKFSDHSTIITASRDLIYKLVIQQENNLSGIFDENISKERNGLFLAIESAGLMDDLKANHGQVYTALTLPANPDAPRILTTEYINVVPDLLPLFKLDPESKSIQDQFIKIYDYLKEDELLNPPFKAALIAKIEEFQGFIEEHILVRQFEANELGDLALGLSSYQAILDDALRKIDRAEFVPLKNAYVTLFENTLKTINGNVAGQKSEILQANNVIYRLSLPGV